MTHLARCVIKRQIQGIISFSYMLSGRNKRNGKRREFRLHNGKAEEAPAPFCRCNADFHRKDLPRSRRHGERRADPFRKEA